MIKIDKTGCGFFEDNSYHYFQAGNFKAPALYGPDYQKLLARQRTEPVIVLESSIGFWWMYKDCFYFENEGFGHINKSFISPAVKSKILELLKKKTVETIQKQTQIELQKVQIELQKVLNEILDESNEAFDKFDEAKDNRLLRGLSVDELKKIRYTRTYLFNKSYNEVDKYRTAYQSWIQKGGQGTFETSPMYKDWVNRVQNAYMSLENVKRILDAGGFKVSNTVESSKTVKKGREPIPNKVKSNVWKRDEGRCVECGSKGRLEYDHIIPLSMGGSNTERNIQLLCEECNRSKGGSLVRKTK